METLKVSLIASLIGTAVGLGSNLGNEAVVIVSGGGDDPPPQLLSRHNPQSMSEKYSFIALRCSGRSCSLLR
jgi:hypothetical protein